MKEPQPGSGAGEFELFQRASELPAGERGAFLDRACGGDRELRAGVEELLRCSEASGGGFLEGAAFQSESEEPGRFVAGEGPGDRVGNYLLEDVLGEGGFGIVFRAQQVEPVRRKVALKIIKPGMDTKGVVARFEAERQALAAMDHPGVVKVFDAGSTGSGRPYFVMELVDGTPVNELCTRERLNTRDRLELFCAICDAVQHAHEHGIVHRDLKPSNILVRRDPGGFRVKVIDFGVAKALSRELTESTLYTAFGQVIGTLQYMSPEQSEAGGAGIDKRADIYSLGAVLYELLVDRTPLDIDLLRRSGFEEILRLIREAEPPRPSTRMRRLTQDEITALAATRREIPERLSRLLKGDLDWIVMKALDKDRDRRYGTAGALAEDLRRYLANRPVTARPPTSGYRLRKLLLRHLGAVRTVALTCAACALAVLLWWAWTRTPQDGGADRPSGFSKVDTASAPGYRVAAHPYLREHYGIAVAEVDPPGSKVVFLNNLSIYGGDAVAPGPSQNVLTQIETGGRPGSYTMSFPAGASRVEFTRPALFPATESGITHPAWTAVGLGEGGEELCRVDEGLIRRFLTSRRARVPAKTFVLEAGGAEIRAMRVESDNRLDGRPFAAFEGMLMESLFLEFAPMAVHDAPPPPDFEGAPDLAPPEPNDC